MEIEGDSDGGGSGRRQEVTGRAIALGAASLFGVISLAFVIAAFVKLATPTVPVFAVLFCRFLFCLPLLFAYGWYQRGGALLQINSPGVLVRRTVFGFTGLTAWFLAISMVDLSLATALAQTMPIFITVMSIPILGESVGWRRIGAVLAGLAGVLVLLGPVEMAGNLVGISFALAHPFFSALMFVYLRKLGLGDAPISTALWHNMAGVVASFLLGMADGSVGVLFGGGVPAEVWLMLVAIGVLASLQQFLMPLSHSLAPASVLAPVHYSAIPLGVAVGVVFFGERITLPFVAGVVVIVLATYYILVRERAKRG